MSDEISQSNNTVNNADPGQNTGQAAAVIKPPLISFGNLLSQTWAFYKKRAKVFLLILTIPAVLNVAFGFLSEFVGYFAGLFTLVGFFVGIWAGLALVFTVIDDQLNLKQAFTAAWHKLLSYFWLVILSSLIIAGGFLFFVVPGVILSVLLVFAVYVFVTEGLKGHQALLKSKAYVKGYWWSVFGRLLAFQLLVMLVFLPLGFIFGFGSLVIGLSNSSLDSFLFGLLMSIFTAAVSILIMPFSVIYSFLIYQDIKNKKKDLVFQPTKKAKICLSLWAVWVFVAVSLMISLTVVGVWFFRSSDTDLAKTLRDSTRTTHQFQILYALNGYYYNQKEYPQSLEDLKNNDYLLNIPQDPKTGQAYEYELTEQGQNFSLCLNFEKKDRKCFDKETSKEQSEHWQSDQPQDQSPQFNFLWIKFASKPIQWFSAIIGARNLLTH